MKVCDLLEGTSPCRLYHVSLRKNRENILRYGLRRENSETAELAREMGEPGWQEAGGIFFCSRLPAPQRDIDIWSVDVSGLNLVPDETTEPFDEDDTWWATYTDPVVEPERLRLV